MDLTSVKTMNKESLAAFAKLLDGKSYREEIPKNTIAIAKKNGLVIIYGHSDDLMEIEGTIYDEGGCYGGGEFFIDKKGLLPDRDEAEDDDELESWLKRKKKAKKIEAIWCAKGEPAWTYKTDIPHATFNVMDDGEIQCRGIVFNKSDL